MKKDSTGDGILTIDKLKKMTDVVLESSKKIIKAKKSSKTIYKCPYCNFRGNKYDCIEHIEKAHKELIPEGYTAARLFFNYINKKTKGSCIVCKKESDWNEDTWRYNRLCNNPKCKEKYSAIMSKGMVDKYGKATLLNDAIHQQKMLERRSISGKYKFKDGGVKTYVGSYEKNLLEYFDKVLNVPSKDILTPGPNIKYQYKGKQLLWITDLYYIPANLIIEVKDGGNNPNKRKMVDYRAKQIAKEQTLLVMNKYNYIRLTDNNFMELSKTLQDIKVNMESDKKNDLVHNVLESCSAVATAIVPSNSIIMVNKMINNKVYETGFTDDNNLKSIYFLGIDGKLRKDSINDIDTDYITKKTSNKKYIDNYYKLLKEFEETSIYNPDYLYEFITEEKIMIPNQHIYNTEFTDYIDDYKSQIYTLETIDRFEPTKDFNNRYRESLPIFECENIYDYSQSIVKDYPELKIRSVHDGFIIVNILNGLVSEVFHRLEDIKYKDLDRLSGGKL